MSKHETYTRIDAKALECRPFIDRLRAVVVIFQTMIIYGAKLFFMALFEV